MPKTRRWLQLGGFLLVLGVPSFASAGGGVPAAGVISNGPATSPNPFLQKLQLLPEQARHAAERPSDPPRGIAETIRALQHQPRTVRPLLMSLATRQESAIHTIRYLTDDAELSSSAHQHRVDTTHRSLERAMRSEFGDRPASAGDRVVVYRNRRHWTDFNAFCAEDGSLLVSEKVLSVADELGAAVASARNSEEFVANVKAVSNGTFVPPKHVDRARAKEVADGALAFVMGHEMAHGWRDDGSTNIPGIKGWRALETISDAGGAELATRSGHSLLGQAALIVYVAMVNAANEAQHPGSAKSDTHQSGAKRYEFLLRYWQRRKDTSRIVYEHGRQTRRGSYFAPAQRDELEKLPSLEVVLAGTQAAAREATAHGA